MRLTKFHNGFIRRKQVDIRQDENRKQFEVTREERKNISHEKRRDFLSNQTYKSGYANPITGQFHEETSKAKAPELNVFYTANQHIRRHFADKYEGSFNRSSSTPRNSKREVRTIIQRFVININTKFNYLLLCYRTALKMKV